MERRGLNSGLFVYFAVFAVNILSFSAGGGGSWPSPILPKLSSSDPSINPLQRPITTQEESWIAAIVHLGALISPFLSGVLSEKVGKRKALLVLGMTFILAHILCAFAVTVHFFLIARFLIGIGAGSVFGIIPGYVTDIAEERNRGALGSILGVFNSLGSLFMYVAGPFLSIRVFSIVNLIPPIIFYIIVGFFVLENPYDLVKRGKLLEAEASLAKLRGKSHGDVLKELAFITESVASCSTQSRGFMFIFKDKMLMKGLLITTTLMFFQQFSGICAVLSYMQTIFEVSGTTIPPTYSAMLVGFIQLLSSSASAQLIEKAGRKMLLLLSFIFCIVSLISLGAFFFLKSSGRDVGSISWLPIACLVIFTTAFNLGLANIPWIISAELFSSNTKGLASTVTSFSCFFNSFLVTMYFPLLSEALGMTGSFWIFAAVSLMGLIFCVKIIPETKGKSAQEIQNILGGTEK